MGVISQCGPGAICGVSERIYAREKKKERVNLLNQEAIGQESRIIVVL